MSEILIREIMLVTSVMMFLAAMGYGVYFKEIEEFLSKRRKKHATSHS